jgi:tetratricopeptide (TPR) repeat protein
MLQRLLALMILCAGLLSVGLAGGDAGAITPGAAKEASRPSLSLEAQDAFSSGMTAMREGRWADATAAFSQSLTRDPGFAPAAAGLAYVALIQQDYPGTASHFAHAVAIDSLGYEPREGLFFSLYLAGRTKEAIRAYEDMLRIDTDYYRGANKSWEKHSLLVRQPSESIAGEILARCEPMIATAVDLRSAATA